MRLNDTELTDFAEVSGRMAASISSVLLGKADVVRLALIALFAEGHLLVEDVPGVGKTTLARAVAATVIGHFRRIQFTPDLLPSDVSGVTVFNQARGQFEFHPGPVFANVVVADEINRASPKTQSALLEVMEERHVTVDGVRHAVPRPFLVCATQNPVEMDGTYRLPEAQLDRFLMKVSVGYPDEAHEIEVMRGDAVRSPETIVPVATTDDVARMIGLATRVVLHDAVYAYIRRIAVATRRHPEVRLGLSPRGCVALSRAARAAALTEARPYALAEDVKSLAPAVCSHRLLLTPDAAVRGRTAADVIAEILDEVAAPLPVLSGDP
ncbi:AAA family ATPase [Dactylosporangium roseum]|uniref:AAA family ATPase n=1 Tax=Dactylosporangium roseum TaxID=47989 RepID=A0ABY5YXH9_9ACTN|nr:AAA family ATPase [Dactylosporangium roseum]UWZ34449.1 AAA family ATPase [Dactylosporangium roseum]